MSALSYAALGLSIVSLILSLYALFVVSSKKVSSVKLAVMKRDDQTTSVAEKPVPESPQAPKKSAVDVQLQPMIDQIQKFSSMVSKNLEQLNTKVGVKSNVRPIDFSSQNTVKKDGPSVVDSEVSDNQQGLTNPHK